MLPPFPGYCSKALLGPLPDLIEIRDLVLGGDDTLV